MSEFSYDDYDNGPFSVPPWYDFVCPFSYIGQHRTAMLVEAGFDVVALPLQAHPGMPAGGLPIGPRREARDTRLEQEARAAGLTLRWPRRIPHSRRALATAEWARRNQPGAFGDVHRMLFEAHFALGEDIDNQTVIDRHAAAAGVDLRALHTALDGGSAAAAISQAEWLGGRHGVDGTPAWPGGRGLIIGLQNPAGLEAA